MKTRRLTRAFARCLAGVLLLPVGIRTRAEDVLILRDVSVTARAHAARLSSTPGSIAIVTAADLAAMVPLDAAQAVDRQPGVHRAADGAWGGDVNIRGLSRSSVVLLIDGCRVNTATDINARFGLLHPLEVARIEVLKGPVSALYGSGSLGGVVNVITRTGRFSDEPEATGHAALAGRSNPSGFDAYAAAGWNAPRLTLFASQSARAFDEYEDGDGRTVANTQFRDRSTHVRAGWKAVDSVEVHGSLQHVEGEEIGIPGSGTAPLPSAAEVTYPRVRRGLFNLAGVLAPETGVLAESRLNAFYQYIDRQVRIDEFPAAAPLRVVYPEADHDTLGVKWINRLAWNRRRLGVGIDAWRRALSSRRERRFKNGAVREDTPLPDAEEASIGFFVEDDVALGQAVTLNAGGRVDSIRVSNEATDQWDEREVDDWSWNAHLGATVHAVGALSLKGIVASGYRAAGIEERYQYLDLGGGLVKLGDPELDPERSLFAELGVDLRAERMRGSVSVFHNELRDLIGESRLDETTIVNANVDEARIYGAEAELAWRPAGVLELRAGLSWTRGEDTRTDEPLPEIPPLSGLLGLELNRPRGFWGRIDTQFADRPDRVPDDAVAAAGWATVNLRVGYRHAAGWGTHHLFAGADNLFDKTYRDYLTTWRGNTFNEPGRSFVLGYEATF